MQRIARLRHVVARPPSSIIARSIQTRQPPPRPAGWKPASPRNGPPSRRPEPAQNESESKPPGRKRVGPVATMIMSTFGVGIGFYVIQLVTAVVRAKPDPALRDLSKQKDVAARYDDTADTFDSEVGMSEFMMGINKRRKKLAAQCTGHVLEVSCGTGRNLGYYDIGEHGKVDSLTFIDLSPQMIDVCKKKWDVLQSSYGKGWFSSEHMKKGLTIRFLPASALDAMPLAPNGKKYDTIIQTMGLCSTPSPVELLTNMVKHLDTSNPNARILLLEHGRSYQQWLNTILDDAAEKHAEIHGCWFNREISDLVEEAAKQTGLEVVRERRHQLGTTYVFELKPKETESQNRGTTDTTQSQDAGKTSPETSKWNPKTWFG